MAIMKAGHIAWGPLAGAEWVIERLNGEHYLLRVGGSFYSSAGCVRALLDEVEYINRN